MCVLAPMFLKERMGGDGNMKTAFTYALWLAILNFANSNDQPDKATVDAHRVCYLNLYPRRILAVTGFAYRRGLLRCSFCWFGQCEGLGLRDE